MLKQRVITALILVFVVLSALFTSNSLFWRLLISAVLLVAFWEWLRFSQVTDYVQQILCFLLFVCVFALLQFTIIPLSFVIVVSCLLWVVLLFFTISNLLEVLHKKTFKLLVGVWVLSASGAMIIQLKLLENGIQWILCCLVAIWAADIGAYFSGRRFGKIKLAPKVSPGKTVEGLVGGLLLVLILYAPVLIGMFTFGKAFFLLVTVLVTALISVGGDLFESKLKRYVGMKDSSQVLPGHGGVLDRIDSLLAGVPFFMLGLLLLGYIG